MTEQEQARFEWNVTRGGKSGAQEIWAAALARVGWRVLKVRLGGQTAIRPFKRRTPLLAETE